MSLSTGTKLGRYEIRTLIGAGGMGEVYLARDPKIGRDVAINVLPGSLSDVKERLELLEGETRNDRPVPLTGLTEERNHYLASPEAKRFLVNNLVEESFSTPVTVVLKWQCMIKK